MTYKLHDFKCKFCDFIFEDLIRKDDPLPKCKKCNCDSEKIIAKLADYTGARTRWVNAKLGKHGAQFKE